MGKSLDDKSYLQRYTPRGKRSISSQINVDNVARLIDEGRMMDHGLRQVEAAKVDGRWDVRPTPLATASRSSSKR